MTAFDWVVNIVGLVVTAFMGTMIHFDRKAKLAKRAKEGEDRA